MRTVRCRAWALVVLAVVAGCGGTDSASAPSVPFTVNITSTTSATGHTIQQNGINYYGCTFNFALSVTGGSPADLMGWSSGEVDFRLSSNGTTSSSALFDTDLQDWFGSSTFATGSTKTASRNLFWSGPFTANVLFRFITVIDLAPTSRTIAVPVSCP